jgi:phosphoglycerol geranylgeranyltransferase
LTVYEKLLNIKDTKGCGFLVLLDPDRKSSSRLSNYVKECESAGVDGFLFGSSLMLDNQFEEALSEASSSMVSAHGDAILFLSLISGRNPNLLIEEHVKSAPIIRALGLEAIPTAYMLIESGVLTSVSYISNTLPIPRNKPDIACAHALAGQYLGMKLVYLEAGSGGQQPVPLEMIEQVSKYIEIPIIVGGGIRDIDYAGKAAHAGASFIVVGNALEQKPEMVKKLANAIHHK